MSARTEPQDRARPDEETQKVTVFYDGSCPLCQAEIAYYRNRDTREQMHLVDVSIPEVELPAELDRTSAMARFHAVTRDGQLLSGAAAFVEVWKQVPGWKMVARIASWPGVLPLLELVYRAFLLMRPVTVRLFVTVRGRGGKTNAEL